MNFSTYLTCFTVILSAACYSSGEPELFAGRVSKPSLKRSNSVLEPGTMARRGDISIPEGVLACIFSKAEKLRPSLNEASSSLEMIRNSLATKAISITGTNYRRATELAGVETSVKGMIGSTLGILLNLNNYSPEKENSLLNMSVAVMASEALKEELNQLIDHLASKPDTSDIDCSVLKEVSKSIHEATYDIENFTLDECED